LNDDSLSISENENEILRDVQSTYETAAIMSSLSIVYKYSQIKVSQRLSTERPEFSFEVQWFISYFRLFLN
jgi:hypothetical protein